MAREVTAGLPGPGDGLPGPGDMVLVTGEPGAGKSALLEDAGRHWDGAVFRTAGTAASAAEPLAAAGVLLPGWSPADAGAAAVRAGVGRIRELANGRPVLVVVDNANHVAPESAALLRRVAPVRAAWLLACPDGTEPPARLTEGRQVRRVVVAPLGLEPARRLAAGLLGGPVDGLTAHRIWRSSGGNPRLLTHLVLEGHAAGALAERAGVWRWTGAPPSGPGLRDLLLAVTGQLSEREVTALEYLACAEGAPVGLLSGLVDPAAVDGLRRRRLVEFGAGSMIILSRPLYAQAVCAPRSALRRRRIHQELVAAATATGSAVPAVLLTEWRVRAGETVPAATLAAAARRALAEGDARAAERLARVAGDVALLGRALVARDRPVEAEEALRQTACAQVRALNRLWGLRRAEPPAVTAGPAAQAAALFVPGVPATAATAVDSADPVLAAADAALTTFRLVFAGAPERVVRENRELPRLWPSMRGAAAACRVHALVLTGRMTAARDTARAYYEAAVAGGEPAELAPLALQRGVCEWWAGSPRRAMPFLREAMALVDDRVPFPIRAYVRSEYAVCLAALGDGPQAYRLIAALRTEQSAGPGLDGQLRTTELQVMALTGRYVHAADLAVALAADLVATGRDTERVEALYLACRLRPSRAVAAGLAAAVDAADSPFFPLLARHAVALAEGDGAELIRCADAFERSGYPGLAAEACAGVDEARARRLVDSCDGFRPAWLPGRSGPATLTGREREVCELAAAGLSNASISQRLGISVRTVGNHLQRAYEKLHLTGRRDLGAALGLS
ncbi:transcriptional regulatory protein degU [Actinoplanes sp. SE50]|uniref:helix-turn-helix transcriptional regulator n=1 Tax=unclassified Actinoplanes TaxID=2626549 RepID=UPI00023ED499|nr:MULTISPECIES: LuxR C-terminal-related transcriptional regulator [unclassified Actinoplanes]AEV86168.1 Transcriptional regulatory protein degU [Actinoplanes sp. SE50/110]ATO84566.1 transcriptional regulatory protein degU [Actinoplanes sp. SE50]SLM01976.1 LuxR-family transcriptional regulator [Actinoplanes sp. SE50/110]